MKLFLARIDLGRAEIALFDQYEAQVLALLPRHGGRLVERLRQADGDAEFHLLQFPDSAALDAFRSDPERQSLQPMWRACGAGASLVEVVRIADNSG